MDLDNLEKLAKAVKEFDADYEAGYWHENGIFHALVDATDFLQAANPQAILEMITELRELRADNTEHIKTFINKCLTISLDDLDSFKLIGELGELGNKIISVRDNNDHLLEILGKIWALIYHGDTESWEYPGQILNHIRVELEARQSKIDRIWIPVSERLPAAMQSVLVQFQDGEMSVTYRAKQMRGSTIIVDWMLGNPKDLVVAWQPLPAPYEARNE